MIFINHERLFESRIVHIIYAQEQALRELLLNTAIDLDGVGRDVRRTVNGSIRWGPEPSTGANEGRIGSAGLRGCLILSFERVNLWGCLGD